MCEGEGRYCRQCKIFLLSCFLQDLGLIAFTFPELGSEELLSSKKLGETYTWKAGKERDGFRGWRSKGICWWPLCGPQRT